MKLKGTLVNKKRMVQQMEYKSINDKLTLIEDRENASSFCYLCGEKITGKKYGNIGDGSLFCEWCLEMMIDQKDVIFRNEHSSLYNLGNHVGFVENEKEMFFKEYSKFTKHSLFERDCNCEVYKIIKEIDEKTTRIICPDCGREWIKTRRDNNNTYTNVEKRDNVIVESCENVIILTDSGDEIIPEIGDCFDFTDIVNVRIGKIDGLNVGGMRICIREVEYLNGYVSNITFSIIHNLMNKKFVGNGKVNAGLCKPNISYDEYLRGSY